MSMCAGWKSVDAVLRLAIGNAVKRLGNRWLLCLG